MLNNQGQINQEFLDFLNTTTAEMRKLLEKPSSRRRTTINPDRSDVAERLYASTPLSRARKRPGVRDHPVRPLMRPDQPAVGILAGNVARAQHYDNRFHLVDALK